MEKSLMSMMIAIVGVAALAQVLQSLMTTGRQAPADGRGDIDMDGLVTENDLALLMDFITTVRTPTDEEFRRADVNCDGTLNTLDVTLLERYIGGIDFPPC